MASFISFTTAASIDQLKGAKSVLVNMDLIEDMAVEKKAIQTTLELRSSAAGTRSVYFGPADMTNEQINDRLSQLVNAAHNGGSATPLFGPGS